MMIGGLATTLIGFLGLLNFGNGALVLCCADEFGPLGRCFLFFEVWSFFE